MSKRHTEPCVGLFEAAAAMGYESTLAAELEEVVDDSDKKARVDAVLAYLDEREKSVSGAVFGFDTGDAMTEREAAEYLEMSQPTLHRTRVEALRKMRDAMGAW